MLAPAFPEFVGMLLERLSGGRSLFSSFLLHRAAYCSAGWRTCKGAKGHHSASSGHTHISARRGLLFTIKLLPILSGRDTGTAASGILRWAFIEVTWASYPRGPVQLFAPTSHRVVQPADLWYYSRPLNDDKDVIWGPCRQPYLCTQRNITACR